MNRMNYFKKVAYLLYFAGVFACNSSREYQEYADDSDASIAEDTLQQEPEPYKQEGEASFYARSLQGSKMANGEAYKHSAMTAAHRKLPLGTKVEVVNDDNDSSVVVEITDRGPYAHNRIIDLSRAAAKELDFIQEGKTDVEIEVVEPAEGYSVSDSVSEKNKK